MEPQAAVEAWIRHNWDWDPKLFTVPVEGANIACRGWNMADADAPGIILVHGYLAHARWWDHIGPALAETHRVVALDLSGMGDSDHRETYSRRQNAREILAVAAHCGFAGATVVGHSFGGVCAMLAAREGPDQVVRLVVVDSGVPAIEDAGRPMAMMPVRFYDDAEEAVERYRLLPPGGWPQPLVLDYIARHAVHDTPDGWTLKYDAAVTASYNEEDYIEALYGITVPVDVIYGEHTEVMTPGRRARLRTFASNIGQDVAIPHSHHHIMIEQPIALVAALRALLANPRG